MVFRELSFSRLECGVHDRLHIYPLCGIFYFPWHRHQIEGTNGFYCLIRKTERFTISNVESQVFLNTPNNSRLEPGSNPGCPRDKRMSYHWTNCASLCRTGILIRFISKLSATYQLCAIHTADNTDGKVTFVLRLSAISEKVHILDPPASFFSGVYSWLVKVLGQFSIIYFRGLGLRIGVRVGVRVWVRVRVRVSVVLWSGKV